MVEFIEMVSNGKFLIQFKSQQTQLKTISAIAPETGISFVWLELDEGEVVLHVGKP